MSLSISVSPLSHTHTLSRTDPHRHTLRVSFTRGAPSCPLSATRPPEWDRTSPRCSMGSRLGPGTHGGEGPHTGQAFFHPLLAALSPPLCRSPLHSSSGVCGNQTAEAVQPGSLPPRPQGTGRGRREPQRLKPEWPPAREGGFWRELGCLPDEGVSSLLGSILWDPRASSKESLAPVFSPYTHDPDRGLTSGKKAIRFSKPGVGGCGNSEVSGP